MTLSTRFGSKKIMNLNRALWQNILFKESLAFENHLL